MRFALVLLLVALATVALSVEGLRHVVKRRSAKWRMPINDEFDEKIGKAFQQYNRVPAREWFGPVSFNVEKKQSIGRLGRFHMYYRDGSFGIFSYVKGEQDGQDIVTLHYTFFTSGRPPMIEKEKVVRLEEDNPYQMFGIMRTFVEEVKQSERERLELDIDQVNFFVVRNVMWFRLKKVRGNYRVRAHSRIFINEQRKDHFSEVFDLESGSLEEVADALANYWNLVRSRNVEQYKLLMAELENEAKPPKYTREFDFYPTQVGGELGKIGHCVIKNDGEVVDMITTIITYTNEADLKVKIEEFQEDGCPLPDNSDVD